jgi:hypothetical protein
VKRPLAVLTVPLAVLGFVACGDDDDEDTGTTPSSVTSSVTSSVDGTVPEETTGDSAGGVTLPSLPDISLPDTLPGGITLPDISLPDVSDIEQEVKDQFIRLGMTEEQAQCLVDQIDLSSGEIPDLSNIMDLLDDCDINLGDLNPDG